MAAVLMLRKSTPLFVLGLAALAAIIVCARMDLELLGLPLVLVVGFVQYRLTRIGMGKL